MKKHLFGTVLIAVSPLNTAHSQSGLPQDIQQRLRESQERAAESQRMMEEARQRSLQQQQLRDAAAARQRADFNARMAESRRQAAAMEDQLNKGFPSGAAGSSTGDIPKPAVCAHGYNHSIGCPICHTRDSESDEYRRIDQDALASIAQQRILENNMALRQREAEMLAAQAQNEANLNRAFELIGRTLTEINGSEGQPESIQSINKNVAESAEWRRLLSEVTALNNINDSSSRPSEKYIDETPQEFKDQILGYEDGFMVESPAGMTKEEALQVIEQAKREAVVEARRDEYINDELRNLLDEANQDARDLRDGGSLRRSGSLPGDNDPQSTGLVKERLDSYIKKRREIDEKAKADPNGPKNYISKGDEFQKRLDRILGRRVDQ